MTDLTPVLRRLAKRCEEELAGAAQRAEDWKGRGFGSGAVGLSVCSTRPVVDTTATAAIGDPLAVVAAAEEFGPALADLERAARHVDRLLTVLRVPAPPQARPRCENCRQPSNWPDRWGLKAGRCVQCHDHHRSHGHDRLLDVGRLSDRERRKCLICERAA